MQILKKQTGTTPFAVLFHFNRPSKAAMGTKQARSQHLALDNNLLKGKQHLKYSERGVFIDAIKKTVNPGQKLSKALIEKLYF